MGPWAWFIAIMIGLVGLLVVGALAVLRSDSDEEHFGL